MTGKIDKEYLLMGKRVLFTGRYQVKEDLKQLIRILSQQEKKKGTVKGGAQSGAKERGKRCSGGDSRRGRGSLLSSKTAQSEMAIIPAVWRDLLA